MASKEHVRDYFVTADLHDILRASLSEILRRDDRPGPKGLLEALGRDLLTKSGAEPEAVAPPAPPSPPPRQVTLELGGPSASTEAKLLREQLRHLENLQ